MLSSRPGGVVALLAALVVAEAAHAQTDCPDPLTPGPVEVTPAASAGLVPLDARIRVLFTPGYFAPGGPSTGTETITLHDLDGDPVPGVVRQVGDALFFLPDALLDPSMLYEAVATGGSRSLDFQFSTGTEVDDAAPVLGPITGVTVDPVDPSCAAPAGGFRVGVSFEPAADDAALGSLEYHLFLTRGAGVGAPVRVARLRHFASEEITAAFVLTDDQVDGLACVSLRVEDGVGHVTEGEGVCFDPITGGFFAPLCSAAGAGARGAPALAVLPLAALAVVFLRRKRRRA